MAVTRYTDDEGNYYILDSSECGFATLSLIDKKAVIRFANVSRLLTCFLFITGIIISLNSLLVA